MADAENILVELTEDEAITFDITLNDSGVAGLNEIKNVFYAIPASGIAALESIVIPESLTYVQKEENSQFLYIYVNGILQLIDTDESSNDNDYWEVSETSVRFNYNLPEGAIIQFVIMQGA